MNALPSGSKLYHDVDPVCGAFEINHPQRKAKEHIQRLNHCFLGMVFNTCGLLQVAGAMTYPISITLDSFVGESTAVDQVLRYESLSVGVHCSQVGFAVRPGGFVSIADNSDLNIKPFPASLKSQSSLNSVVCTLYFLYRKPRRRKGWQNQWAEHNNFL